ncbi:MAG: HEAT repeat domain-containing protein, partial [Gomphosphaeria aponina SAG 52.96 = DSM 107014]|nr:HEAT repeat domain-containing protein [Gomphosphaeria aponina SAG 52.96 = DSM 107014]
MKSVVKNTENLQKSMPHEHLELEATLQENLQVMINGDFQTRWEVGKILAKQGKAAIAPLREILADNDADLELRWFAGRILSEFKEPEIIISLVKLLEETEEIELCKLAISALANIGSPAIEALKNLLTQEDTKLLAIQALGQITNPQTIEPLLTMVDDPVPLVRATAIEALGNFHEDSITPVLVKALTDKAAAVRKEAVAALGRKKNFNVVTEVAQLLDDLNYQVCQTAAIALGRIGTDEAAAALFHVLKSPATPASLKLDIV